MLNRKLRLAKAKMSTTTTGIYHERQSRQLCALHTLNNLFQDQTFTKEELDRISTDLSPAQWINPHRSVLGLGNYDVNVIFQALQLRNCEANWFDKRKDPACIDLSAIVGFILNVPSPYKLGFVTLPLWKHHWIALRRVGNDYYNLDSKLPIPKCIGDEADLLSFLRSQLAMNEHELFVVVERTPEQSDNTVGQDTPPRWLKRQEDMKPPLEPEAKAELSNDPQIEEKLRNSSYE